MAHHTQIPYYSSNQLACENSRFLSLLVATDVSRGGSSLRSVPSGEERGETALFAGYKSTNLSKDARQPRWTFCTLGQWFFPNFKADHLSIW